MSQLDSHTLLMSMGALPLPEKKQRSRRGWGRGKLGEGMEGEEGGEFAVGILNK